MWPSACGRAEFSYENSYFDDSDISLPAVPSRTNLKLHDTLVTHKIVKKVNLMVDFNVANNQFVSFDASSNFAAIYVKMDGSLLSSKLDWGSYIISIGKTTSNKIGALIRSMKFRSPEVALYLYKSTIRRCVEYCCHVCCCRVYCCRVWAGAPSCYFEMLDKLQKWICRTVGSSLAISLESLAHRRNVTSLSLFYMYYFSRCSSELAQLVPLSYSRKRSTRCSDRLYDFAVTIS